MVKCMLCEREFKSFQSLGKHLNRTHHHSLQDYYDQYLLDNEIDKYCYCGKLCSFVNIKSGYLKYCSNLCASHDPRRSIDIRITSNRIYGYDSPNQSPSVKKKKAETTYKHYGVSNVFKSEEIKNIIKETNKRLYGVERPLQSPDILHKVQNTNLDRYGVPWVMQCDVVRNKSKFSCLQKYGVDNFSKTSQGREISRKNFIRMIENEKLNGETLCGRVGDMERPCFNELENHIDYKIIRNPQVIGYIPDGYILELNLLVEFDERHHFIDKYHTYRQNDIQKDIDYKNAGFNLVRIKKNDWEDHKDEVINKFKMLISELENDKSIHIN